MCSAEENENNQRRATIKLKLEEATLLRRCFIAAAVAAKFSAADCLAFVSSISLFKRAGIQSPLNNIKAGEQADFAYCAIP